MDVLDVVHVCSGIAGGGAERNTGRISRNTGACL